MVHNIVTGLGLAVLLFGLFVFFTAVLGLYRFDYVLNRMHAAAVGDALGKNRLQSWQKKLTSFRVPCSNCRPSRRWPSCCFCG